MPSKLLNTELPEPTLTPVKLLRLPEPPVELIVISSPVLLNVILVPATSDLNLSVLATLLAKIPSRAAVTPKF